MKLTIQESQRKNFYIILGCDALSFLTALYYQFSSATDRSGVPLHHSGSKEFAWFFFGFMILITVVFIWINREREETIRGLPDDKKE